MRRFSRRDAVGAGLGLAAGALSSAARGAAAGAGPALGPPAPFSFERLKAVQAAAARRPYVPAAGDARLGGVGYDAMRRMTFRPERSLWQGFDGQEVRFFPRNQYADTAARLFAVEAGHAREVLFSPDLFDIADPALARQMAGVDGFSGFRVMNAQGKGDWLAFQGASYFRSSDPYNQYGLSARAIAIDTGADHPESFPDFTAFWLERDAAGRLVVNAALDGEALTGAFRFVHNRGPAGLVQEVEAALFFRQPVARLGLAPLSSMFWYGENQPPADRQWRPEVHDSDGLAIWTGAGERIWRPLVNPPHLTVNSFADRGPRGWGLMQRDRVFDHYQDDGVFYDRRPSAWIEPVGDWGLGAVCLVQFTTTDETTDNVAAFWTPAAPPRAGETRAFAYRLHWTDAEPTPIGVARVVATRRGQGRPVASGHAQVLVVDFEGPGLAGLTLQSGVQAVVSAERGAIVNATAYPIVNSSLWRMVAEVSVDASEPAIVRAFLRRGAEALSETWSYELSAA